jgi:hypothetical protein
MDLQSYRSGTFTVAPLSTIGANVDSHFRDHILRVGLNDAFGGPVVAKYGSRPDLPSANQSPRRRPGLFFVAASGKSVGTNGCCRTAAAIHPPKAVCVGTRTAAIWIAYGFLF